VNSSWCSAFNFFAKRLANHFQFGQQWHFQQFGERLEMDSVPTHSAEKLLHYEVGSQQESTLDNNDFHQDYYDILTDKSFQIKGFELLEDEGGTKQRELQRYLQWPNEKKGKTFEMKYEERDQTFLIQSLLVY
jgi:hypothetical protein